jgi:hypothetical protein
MLRTYSPRNCFKTQPTTPRNPTVEKRLNEARTLKESEIRVSKYKYSIEDELGKGFTSKVYKGVEI